MDRAAARRVVGHIREQSYVQEVQPTPIATPPTLSPEAMDRARLLAPAESQNLSSSCSALANISMSAGSSRPTHSRNQTAETSTVLLSASSVLDENSDAASALIQARIDMLEARVERSGDQPPGYGEELQAVLKARRVSIVEYRVCSDF